MERHRIKMNGIYYRGKDITFERGRDYSIKAVCINEKDQQ